MNGGLNIEKEQIDLLKVLVELMRSMPRDQRRKIMVLRTTDGDYLRNPVTSGYLQRIFMGDLEVLARIGFIDISYGSSGTPNINVLPEGFSYYEYFQNQSGQPLANVENTIRSLLSSSDFEIKYPNIYIKWAGVEQLLWSSDSSQQLTTIGHICREIIQDFVSILVDKYKPNDAPNDKTATIARMRAFINQQILHIGSSEKACLDALFVYWGTLIDLIQRQEHGSQKENEELVWEDGRRVVFQTANVLFEIDKSITR